MHIKTSKTSNYFRSQSITGVDFELSDDARTVSRRILQSASEKERGELACDLVDELCDLAGIDIVNVKVSEAKQYHKKARGRTVYKRYGYYRPASHYIYISNRTAVQGKILAPKSFLETLLHEWMHHYDYRLLNLNSIHTTGFYLRLKSLKIALLC